MQRLGACGFDGGRRGGPGDIGQRGRLGGNDGLAQTGADRSQQQGRSEKKRIRFHFCCCCFHANFSFFKSRMCIYLTVRRGGDFWAKNLSEGKSSSRRLAWGGERIDLWF